MPGISFTTPTVYSVTPAFATTARPGSMRMRGTGSPLRSHSSLMPSTTTLPYCSIVDGSSASPYLMPIPPPTSRSRTRRPVCVVHLAHEADHDLDRLAVALEREDLAADVHVQAGEVDARQRARGFDAGHRESVVQAEAELRVLLPGLDVAVRVRPDTRRDADEHGLASRRARDVATRLMRSSSSSESTTMRSTPASTASASLAEASCCCRAPGCATRGLLTRGRWRARRPEAHRIMQPSSWTRRHIARHMNALAA